MTNREYLDSLSNMDFANFIYSKLLKIGKEYNDSVLGIAHWLGLEKSFENVVLDEPLSPIRDYCVDYTSEEEAIMDKVYGIKRKEMELL